MRKFVLSFWMATIAARVQSAPMPNYIKEVKIFNKIEEVEEEQTTTDGSLCVTVKFGDEKRVNDNDNFDFIYETQLLGTANSPSSSELVFGTKTFNMGSYDVVAPVNMIFLHTCNEEDLKGDDNEAENTPYFLTLSSEDSVLHEYKPKGTVGIIGQASFNIVDVAEEEEQQAELDLIEESTESENNDVRIVQHEYKIVPAHDSEKHHGHKNIKPRPNPLRPVDHAHLKDGD